MLMLNLSTHRARSIRQRTVNEWVARAFGSRFLTCHNRAERVIEEALELAQSVGYPEEKAAALVGKVYREPPGEVSQEIGGLAVCLLSFAEVVGVSADECEQREIDRVHAKPIEHFKRKLASKIEKGICTDEAA